MKTKISEKRVIGELTQYPDIVKGEKRLVSYWNLIRSYILLHYSDKIVLVDVPNVLNSTDLRKLRDVKILTFETKEECNVYYAQHKNYSERTYILSFNGNIID